MTIEQKIFKDLVKISGLKPVEISELTGVPTSRLSEWDNGKRNPKLSSIIVMAEKLGFDFDYSFLNQKSIN